MIFMSLQSEPSTKKVPDPDTQFEQLKAEGNQYVQKVSPPLVIFETTFIVN